MAINETVAEATKKLSKLSETPRLDAEILLTPVLGKSREYILAHPEKKLTESQIARYKSSVARRASSEPIAYILGHKEFYGLDFKVSQNTLIPRPETELLVETILREARHNPIGTIIDVGTGSGNIIVSLAKNIVSAKFFGIDISSEALAVARQNAKIHKVENKIKFIKSDLLNHFIQNTKYKLPDTKLIIIANLPYLSEKIYSKTMPDVKKYEPKSALLSEKEGSSHYEKLLKQIKQLQNSCFVLRASCFIEISPEQKNKIKKLILKYFPGVKIEFKKDLARKWRIAFFEI